MRRDSFIAALALFLVATSCFASGSVAASGSSDFMGWAMSRSGEFDSRWTSIAAPTAPDGSASSGERENATSARPSFGERSGGSQLSHRIVDQTNFIHHVGGDFDFLPMSTRERNGASRGQSALRHPASARLSVPHSVRRPLNSSVQKKNFFHSIGEVTRPRLKSFGYIHPTKHQFGRTPARPSYRAARPRLL